MTKVSVHPEEPAPKKSGLTTDARGRAIKIRKLGPVDRMKLARMLGSDGAQNQVLLGYATLAYAVAEIDGEPEMPPQTERELEALVERLGDEGLEAVGNAYVANFGDAQPTPDAKEAIKN